MAAPGTGPNFTFGGVIIPYGEENDVDGEDGQV